jgi:hypothetical protein
MKMLIHKVNEGEGCRVKQRKNHIWCKRTGYITTVNQKVEEKVLRNKEREKIVWSRKKRASSLFFIQLFGFFYSEILDPRR